MKNFVSTPRPLAAVAFAAVACLLLITAAPGVQAGQEQSAATEAEIAARVRAELEARMVQLTAQLRELEAAREIDLESLRRQLEQGALSAERLQELTQMRLAEAMARNEQQAQASEVRVEEITRRAMEAAEEAMQRAGQVRSINLRGGCDVFGERVLDRAEDLALSDDQIDQIRAAQRASRRDGIGRRADTEVAEMDLEALYEADNPDLAALRAQLEALAMLQVDNQMAGLALREQVREIMTPAQREQWDDLRGDDNVLVISGVSLTRWSGDGWSNFGRFGC